MQACWQLIIYPDVIFNPTNLRTRCSTKFALLAHTHKKIMGKNPFIIAGTSALLMDIV